MYLNSQSRGKTYRLIIFKTYFLVKTLKFLEELLV